MLESLSADFLRLMAQGRMEPLVRMVIRAQGILEESLAQEARTAFKKEFLKNLKDEKQWLLANPESGIGRAVAAILKGNGESGEDLVKQFLIAAREYCEQFTGQPQRRLPR